MTMNRKTIGVATVLIVVVLFGGGFVLMNHDSDEFPTTWSRAKKRVRPQLVQRTYAEEQKIISAEISDKVDLAYVIAMGDLYQFIKNEELEGWGVAAEQLHKTAIANLEKIAKRDTLELQEGETNPDDRYIIVEPGDGYAAARVLLPKFRARISAALGEPFIAGIPTRDFLVFWKDGFSLHDQFAEQVRKEYETDKEFPLTRELLRFQGDRVEMTPTAGQARLRCIASCA